jgi:intracellular septation protein
MKFLFDLFPVLLFFIAFKLADIYVATIVAIATTILQISWLLFKKRKVEPMLWVSLVIIVVFGGATLIFKNETFIKCKPTVLYWAFALALLISNLKFNKNFIRSLMEKQMQLPEPLWVKLLFSWILFFTAMGFINLFVAFNYTTEEWVNFKLFGSMGLMLLFVIGQSVVLAKHSKENN